VGKDPLEKFELYTSIIQQKHWRIAGGVFLLISLAMMIWGPMPGKDSTSFLFLAIYWGIFMIFFCLALGTVWLDFRYIKADIALNRLQIFKDTLGSEEFRATLRKALEEEKAKAAQTDSNDAQ